MTTIYDEFERAAAAVLRAGALPVGWPNQQNRAALAAARYYAHAMGGGGGGGDDTPPQRQRGKTGPVHE